MTAQHWQQVKEIFHSAIELEPGARSAFLDANCAGDQSLRSEVESLIAAHEQDGSFIDTLPYQIITELINDAESLVGQQINHYRILAPISKGGMGEVYAAQDMTLGRKIALKFLPACFTNDADRLRRFKQEARAASALNHPNILTIYEIGETGGHHFLATELIEGETLRELMIGQRMSLTDVLDVAIQTASALSSAHESGIIHRDVKPENIMLRRDRLVKVLDFGLAKLTEPQSHAADSFATTRIPVNTATGVVMGTTQYMSPEQARGLDVDARTDLWSLGVVLQEMVTGHSPFAGPTASDTIANILEHEPPPLSADAPQAPPELQRIIRKMLRKDREERYQTIKDLLVDLKNLKQEIDLAAHPAATARSFINSTSSRRRVALAALALLLVVIIAVGVYQLYSRRAAATKAELDEQTVVLKTTQITTWPGLDAYPTLSPDGNTLAYTSDHNGRFEIYVRPLTPGARELQLTDDGGPNYSAAWSPDGKLIAYVSGKRGGIWVVPASGGAAKQLTEFGGSPKWSPDGSLIVFQSSASLAWEATGTSAPWPPSTLMIVSAQGGEPRSLTQANNPPGGHGNPAWSPDGKRIVFVVSDSSATTDLWNISVAGTDLRQLTDRKTWIYDPIYARDGEHFYYGGVSDTGSFVLYKQRVSPVNGEAVGAPVEVANTGLARIKNLTLSADGKKIAYSAPVMRGNISAVSLKPVSNEAAGAPLLLTQDASYRKGFPTFSPDGQRIAFVEFRGGTNADIWVMAADGRNETQLTTNPAFDWSPSWFPDNDRIAFQSNRQGKWTIWTISVKSGQEKLLVDPGQDIGWARVSPDGKQIVFNSDRSGTTNHWVMPTEGGQPVQLTSEKSGGVACWSPDSKFLAFGIADAQVAIMPSSGGAFSQLTSDQGLDWPNGFSPDGDKITFAGARDGVWNIYWVSRSTREERQLTNYTKRNAFVRYPSWSPDGTRIVYEYSETAGNIWLMELK